MYPYNPWHHHRACSRGPSRILWFLVGAGSATWWIKHHEMRNYYGWGHCHRPSIQNTPTFNSRPPADQSTVNNDGGGGAAAAANAADRNSSSPSSFSFRDIPKTINNLPPSNQSWNWGWGEKREAERQQEEQDRLADLRRQATGAMSDMTEATLESILTTAESLKAKLLENRAQRQKQEELLAKQIEEQSKNPPRLI